MAHLITELKERLKSALIIRDMKPVELSEKTGIPKSAISQYMSGYAKPKNDRVYLICNALDIEEAWLLGYDVPMEKKSSPDVLFVRETSNYGTKHNSGDINATKLFNIYYELNSLDKERLLNYAVKLNDLREFEDATLNAAHEIPGATPEEKMHDEAIMDDENF